MDILADILLLIVFEMPFWPSDDSFYQGVVFGEKQLPSSAVVLANSLHDSMFIGWNGCSHVTYGLQSDSDLMMTKLIDIDCYSLSRNVKYDT